jgi:EAL domain-containing protein (putative c-di-GMP-specific phosphodiesterase class I)
LESNPEHFERLTYASVNLSGASLNDSHFLQEIIELAIEHPQTASKICFEITETVALADIKSTRKFVENVKSLGAKIALDDFGAGHSSYGYITELGANYLKIDGALIKNITSSRANFAVVKSISDLAKSLGMKVIAEWIEDVETLQILQEIGVNSGQGWCLGKPVSGEAIVLARHGAEFIEDSAILDALSFKQIEAQIQ